MSQEAFQSHTVWREAGISLISLYCSSNCLNYYVTSFFCEKVILLFLKEKGCPYDVLNPWVCRHPPVDWQSILPAVPFLRKFNATINRNHTVSHVLILEHKIPI